MLFRSPAGFRLALHGEVRSGRALCGSSVLYFWPGEGRGWQRGRVVRVSSRDSFSHVVRYPRGSVIGDAEVVSLLDLASHGPQGRWVLLLPARRDRFPARMFKNLKVLEAKKSFFLTFFYRKLDDFRYGWAYGFWRK